MRLLIMVLLVSLAVACSARPAAEDDYLYEDAEVPSTKAPTTKAPARGPVHGLRTGRGPSPLLASRGAKTTAAPVKPAEPEVVNEPEDIDDEGPLENEEVVAVTTEAPKKSLRSGMIVRPFRSNQDLLAALKRKRAQEHWRVVYEYLYIRFGYPVNLHHKLDIVPDPDIGSDNDARAEINEVTSGDYDPPPKLKSGAHELVVGLPTQGQVEGDVTGDPVDTSKVKQEHVEANIKPVDLSKVTQERVETVIVTNIKPVDTSKVKQEHVEANVKPVDQSKVTQERLETVIVTNIKPVDTSQVKQDHVEANIKPVDLSKVKQERLETVIVTNTKPVDSSKVKREQIEPIKAVDIKSVDSSKVKREHVVPVIATNIKPVEQERIPTVVMVKVEPAQVRPINGTISRSASFSVSYS